MPENPNSSERRRQAAEQFRALSAFCYTLSDNDGEFAGENLLFTVEAVANALAAEAEKPEAEIETIAATAGGASALLRFAARNAEFKPSGKNRSFDEHERKALESCASMAEVAASLCREASAA